MRKDIRNELRKWSSGVVTTWALGTFALALLEPLFDAGKPIEYEALVASLVFFGVAFYILTTLEEEK